MDAKCCYNNDRRQTIMLLSETNIVYPFDVTWTDYPDNHSVAVLIYMSGCEHNCLGCQNDHMQEPRQVTQVPLNLIDLIKLELRRNLTDKIVLSGGDPLFHANIKTTQYILDNISANICIYTGYDIEYVKQSNLTGYAFIKCGPLSGPRRVSGKTNQYLRFATSNQELYDCNNNQVSVNGTYFF
jgi:organic radical activating enzyme